MPGRTVPEWHVDVRDCIPESNPVRASSKEVRRMRLRYRVGVVLGVALAVTPAPADDDTSRALATIKAVKKEGRGNDDAGPAWKTLVNKGGAALLPALEAFDDANPTATNWLRTAVDAIAEKEKAGGK